MKRLWIAIGLLLIIVALAVTSGVYLKISTEKLSQEMDEIYALSRQENFEAAKKAIGQLQQNYEKAEKWYLVFIRSTPLEDIEEQLDVLTALAEYGDAELLCSETKKAQSLLNHLWKAEQVNLFNVV